MSRIEITVTPSLEEVQARLAKARRKVADRGDPHKQAAAFLDRWVQLNFKGQGAPVGGWPALAPSTVRARVRKNLRGGRFGRGAGRPGGLRNILGESRAIPIGAGRIMILQDTGRLRQSMLPFASADNAGIGSEMAYAKGHQQGEPPHLPQRRILPKQAEVRGDLQEILGAHMRLAFESAGFEVG